jgi:hypothetical protein
VRLTLSKLPLAQGHFKVYVFLADEKALHLHDMRILDPGFSVVPAEYTVGLMSPPHAWRLVDSESAEEVSPPPGSAVSSLS